MLKAKRKIRQAIISTLTVLLLSSSIQAQYRNAVIVFNKTSYNFGTIKEEEGPVEAVFEFVNNGGDPIVINQVHASCGCTTPEWTKQPVKSGETGFIKVIFDPAHRSGMFRKTVHVNTNADKKTVVLTILGIITPKPKTVEDNYPILMEGIRLKSNHFAFYKLPKNKTKNDTIQIINTSKEIKTIDFPDLPDHISTFAVPHDLKPGEEGYLVAEYDASKVEKWGYIIERGYMYLNGKKFHKNLLAYSATLVEDFSSMSYEERKNAPMIMVDEDLFDFGRIRQDTMVHHNFVITNKGKSDLYIRNIKSNCGCTIAEPESDTIAPNESTIIKASFDSRRKLGKQYLTVKVYSNDYRRSELILRIIGDVVQ